MTRADHAAAAPPEYNGPVLRCSHRTDRNLRTLDGEVVAKADYAGKSCLAFAGIARPKEFFQSLCGFGFSRIEEISLADHQDYNRDTLNHLLGSCNNHDLLITTEKDAVKLAHVDFPIPCYQVGVEMAFDDTSALAALLEEVLSESR
jgi:tetraacyldisaccharide 4'-kinase